MSFMDSMQSVLNSEKTFTTNGAIAYKTSGKELLDFNFDIASFRGSLEYEIEKRFARVYYEDKMLALKYLFYLGDIRCGLGERSTFRICMNWLAENHVDIAKALLEYIPEYNRWDSLSKMILIDNVKDDVARIIKEQLARDTYNMQKGNPVSLCAKWLPSENSKSKNTRMLAYKIIESIGMSNRAYRKKLSALRKYIDVVEIKMAANCWGDIKYENVTSKANLRYANAFLRHDEERRREYLTSLSNGTVKINSGRLNPYEIVSKYINTTSCVDATLEELWKALPDITVENTLIIRDGSASMTWVKIPGSNADALDVATSMAIYMAEHNTGDWKNKYITFSQNPKIVDLTSCKTLREKLYMSYNESECSNTNLHKTMELILRTAIDCKIKKEDMPKSIVICSDMQFDGRCHNLNKSLMDDISDMFVENGYEMPRICFWNLDSKSSSTVPMQQNKLGLILCSGFSVNILKMLMSGRTDPYEVLVEQLNTERYLPIERACSKLV